jgi:hypothetical protein
VFAAAFAFQAPTLSLGMVALGIGVGMLFLFEITKKALRNSQPRQAIE